MIEHITSVLKEIIRLNDFSLFNKLLNIKEREWFIDNYLFESIQDSEIQEFFNNSDNESFYYYIYSKDEALNMLNSLNEYDEDRKSLILFALDDDIKIKYLNEIQEYDRVRIINSLGYDELKVSCLDMVGAEYRNNIIKNIGSDELKIKCLKKIYDEYDKVNIIKSFVLDEYKVRCLDMISTDSLRGSIIMSFKSDELKIKCLDSINDDYQRASIIREFDDELKIRCLNKIKDESNKLFIITDLKSDEMKIEYLDNIKDSYGKLIVIIGLKSDKLKIECLKKVDDDGKKGKIICSLKSDELKIKYLNEVSSNIVRSEIIKSLMLDEMKIKCLDFINNEFEKAGIVKKFKSNDLKIECLDKFISDDAKLIIIDSLSYDELKIKYLNKIKDDVKRYDVIKKFNSIESKIECLDLVYNDYQRANIIAELNSDEMKIKYLDKIDDDGAKIVVINSMISDEIVFECLNRVDVINRNFDINRFKIIKDKCAIDYKKFLMIIWELPIEQSINIFSDDNFYKFVELFNKENAILDKNYIDTILEAILSQEFILNNKDIWELFARIKDMCDRGEAANVTQILLNIIKYSQSTFNLVGSDLKEFVNEYVNDSEVLKEFVIRLFDKENVLIRKEAFDKLKVITSQYINLKMEEYKINRKKAVFDNNILLFDRKIERNYFIKYITEHCEFDMVKGIIEKYYPECLLPLYLNNSEGVTIDVVLKWKMNNPGGAPNNIKKYFKVLHTIFVNLYNDHYIDIIYLLHFDDDNIKYDEKYKINNTLEIGNTLLKGINLNGLEKLFLPENIEKYNLIKSFIVKYHLIGLGSVFNELLESNNIKGFDLRCFIEKIFVIGNELEKNNGESNIIWLLKLMDSFDKKISTLIGTDNQRFIVINSNPNAAAIGKEERISMLPRYIKAMYEKRVINIPTISKNMLLSNGKVINVNIGNFTNPINLTYGERTDSCMRIGGVGHRLFEFCLDNASGFHVRFSNTDGDFISRVSGFRVGNTVFLNQLRESVLREFSNNDLLEVCKMVSEELINLTMNSDSPIENVVVSPGEVLKGQKNFIDLGITLYKDGVKTPGYFDVDPRICILLATSNKDEKREFVPFREMVLPEYQVIRDDVKYLNDSESIKTSIKRIRMINEILEDNDIDDVIFKDDKIEYKFGYVGEDFYIAVNIYNNVNTYIASGSCDMSRAIMEVNSILNKLGYDEIKGMNDSYRGSHNRGFITSMMMLLLSFILSVGTIVVCVLGR